MMFKWSSGSSSTGILFSFILLLLTGYACEYFLANLLTDCYELCKSKLTLNCDQLLVNGSLETMQSLLGLKSLVSVYVLQLSVQRPKSSEVGHNQDIRTAIQKAYTAFSSYCIAPKGKTGPTHSLTTEPYMLHTITHWHGWKIHLPARHV